VRLQIGIGTLIAMQNCKTVVDGFAFSVLLNEHAQGALN
jgi:hypothetical protein